MPPALCVYSGYTDLNVAHKLTDRQICTVYGFVAAT